jgi:D-psicose/D-tagatose/L-ribulose 3-epimerase
VRTVGAIAGDLGIAYCLESLNRFEGYLINTASEAVQFVEEVGLDNVKVMLDTFHMNIEEDSFAGAIRQAGSRLGHFHIGKPTEAARSGADALDGNRYSS